MQTRKRVQKRIQKRVQKRVFVCVKKTRTKPQTKKCVKIGIQKNAYKTYAKTRTKTHKKNRVQKRVQKNAYKKRIHATAPSVGDGRSAPTPRSEGSTRVIRCTRGRWTGPSYYTQEPVLFHAKKLHEKGQTRRHANGHRNFMKESAKGQFFEKNSINQKKNRKIKNTNNNNSNSPIFFATT